MEQIDQSHASSRLPVFGGIFVDVFVQTYDIFAHSFAFAFKPAEPIRATQACEYIISQTTDRTDRQVATLVLAQISDREAA